MRAHSNGPRLTPWGILIWSFAAAPARLATLATTLVAVLGAELALPMLLGETVDAAVTKSRLAEILYLGLAMLVVAGAFYIAHYLYLRAEATLVAQATFRLRGHVYRRLIAQPLNFFGQHKGGEIGHRIMSDCEVLDRDGIYLLADVPFAVLTVLGVTAVMLWTHLMLGLLVLGLLVAAAALAHHVARPLAGIEKSANGFLAVLGGRLQELIGGIRTLKTFGRERHEVQRLDTAARDLVAAEIRAGKVAARLEPLLELIESLGLIAVVWYGAYLVFHDVLTPGKLVAFIAYMELLSDPMQQAGRYYRQFQQARGTLGRIADFLAAMPEHPGRAGRAFPNDPTVAVEDVQFGYPGTGKLAVDGVSLVAHPSEIVAVVGPNGAGKSSLMDLLLGLQTPLSGRITIGGVPLEEIDESALRQAIAVLSQDIFLFHASLAENICYGRLDASAADIAGAADRAGLRPLIGRLPHGLQTVIGDRGSRLSGGERQRVALARVLILDPRILIFDEPTSALDGAAVRDAGRVLRGSAPGRVTFVIAHRIETVRIADRALLMNQGRIVAEGTPAELEASNTLFRTLFIEPDRPRSAGSEGHGTQSHGSSGR